MGFFQNVAQRNKDREEIKEKFKGLKCFRINPIRLLKEEKREIGRQKHCKGQIYIFQNNKKNNINKIY